MSKRFDPDHRPVPTVKMAPLMERTLLRQAAESLGEAKCPLCGHVLRARMGKTGPYFHCGCLLHSRREGRR